MILAAPLVIPFAEAVGISIATLGMAKAADMVNDYIQENPEESMKILSTIVPNIGIGQIFANKEDSGDDEEVEVEEDTRSKKEIVLEGVRRARAGKGNYSSPDATGSAVSGQGNVIRGLEDAGKIKKDPDPNYDPSKKYQGYKRFLKKADGGAIGIEVLFEEKKPRKNFNTGGTPYNARATTQDFANALKSVSAGTTYQQQAQAKNYARQEASNLLSQAMRSGNQSGIQSILQGIGGSPSMGGMQFNTSGNRITSIPATGPGRDKILNAMANQMLNTTSYGGGSSAPPQKSPLQLKIEENQRIYNEYVKNNPPAIGLLPGSQSQPTSQGGAPTIPKPEYEDKALLSQLTMLTPEEAFAGETFDTLSDLDQYNFSQAFTQYQPQLRDSSYVSPYGAPDGRQIFSRRYGIKDGGRVGLFMGGDPLTGQALSIYDSMKAYNFSDQEIANALSAQGLYTPGSTPVVEEGIISAAPNIINQGGGGEGDGPPPGPTFNRNDLLGTPDYFPAEPFSFKDTVSDIGEYIKSGGIIGAGIRGLKGLFSRNTKNYVTTPQVKARDRVEVERKAREEAARQEVERQAAYAQARQDRETYKDLEASITSGQGGQGFDRPSSGPTATGAGMGAGGGYASDYGFKDGGLVTMFKEKR